MHKYNGFSLKNNFWLMLIICLSISVVSILLISIIFALVAEGSKDPTGNIGIFSLSALLISGAISGFVSAKIKGEKAIGFSALISLVTIFIMLMLCLIISGKVGSGALMNYLCYMLVSVFFSFIGSREKKHRHHKR